MKAKGSVFGLVLASWVGLAIPVHAATADFQGNCSTSGSNVSCLFDAQRGSGSTCPGSAILTYSYSYGDGSGGLSGNPASHTYTAPLAGAYQVDLTVYCWDGNQASKTRWVCVAYSFPGCINNNGGWM
jgi:hypothetical protein